MKAAIYGRVSTVDKQDVSTQMDALRDYAKGKGYDEVVEFVDVGVSGAKDKRPALDKLIEGVKNKDFCAVICYKMDRLARSLKNLMFLLNLFTENDVAFISLSENIDLSTSIGKLMVHVLGSFSHCVSKII
ncbi:MAG: recombinase family protein [Nitrospirae bacterium YQR-1]